MFKRTICSLLWLIAVGWAFNFISAYTGAPQLIGSVVAIAVAVFVGLDPLHALWPARERSPATSHQIAPAVTRVPNRI